MSIQVEPSVQTPDIGCLLSHFLRQIEGHHVKTPSRSPLALHYNHKTQSLSEYPWPCDPTSKRRIPPSELEAFRRTHMFVGPCCLCSYLDGGQYTEARIGIVSAANAAAGGGSPLVGPGAASGEYVATCARQRCGYYLCLERFYPLNGLKLKTCRKRGIPLPVEDLSMVSLLGKELGGGQGILKIIPDTFIRGPGNLIQKLDVKVTKAAHLRRVKAFVDGIPEHLFWELFVQCITCKHIMFGDCGSNHICQCAPSNVCISADLNTGRRHHPYRSRPNVISRIRSRMGQSLGDHPQEVVPTRSLRFSPVPTEVDLRTDDDEAVPSSDRNQRLATEEAADIDVEIEFQNAVDRAGDETEVIPASSDDVELPSILQIFDATRRSRD
ncbi:hypothetical protein NMY22_g17436 [Coprinellus aureogranulatus]|nr:hypothetical protein NMY22_g17436 [Coprinellus aureogranulatus]